MAGTKRRVKVMVFGVFDRLHAGHLHMLHQASRKGSVVAVVARDSAARKLKGRDPQWDERKRLRAVRMTGLVDRAVLGDQGQGGYAVIKRHRPDAVCLGYDQVRLKKDLAEKMPGVVSYVLRPYKADVFHSSIRRKIK